MPTRSAICNKWHQFLSESCGKDFLEYDSVKVCMRNGVKKENICFACGFMGYTERCHITPRHIGGADTSDNLHLLCRECHLESEYINDRAAYFDWIITKDASNSGSWLRHWNLSVFYAKRISEGNLLGVPDLIINAAIDTPTTHPNRSTKEQPGAGRQKRRTSPT